MKKILLVEDEQDLRENIISLLLEKGYEVVAAENGLEAIKLLESDTPDLIISDIMMPYLDGYEFLKKVKQKNDLKIIPFLFLTAKSDLTSIRRGMNSGVDDYITKPFCSNDLLRSIEIRLEKSAIVDERINEIKDNISKYVPHELRNPLVAILGYSQIISSEINNLDKNEILEMNERINISARRLHNRIEKFIQFSDLENITSNIVQTSCTIDKNVIMDLFFKHYYLSNRKDKIEISLRPAQLKIAERFLLLIINELLENAVKFSDSTSPIFVNGYSENNFYNLEIKDHGIGMEEYQIADIGAFQQFNREEYQQEGNGIGLVMVKKVLENCDGSFKIESKKNIYTRVCVKIPLA